MKFRFFIFMFLTCFFVFSCSSSKQFKSIRCIYDKDAQLKPGSAVGFGVVAIDKNDKKVITKGFLKGKYNINYYNVDVAGGWHESGVVFIDTNDDLIVNRSVKITVSPVKKPSLKDSIEFFLNYEGIVSWNFSGDNGKNGKNGSSRIVPIRVFGTAIATGKEGDNGTSGSNGMDVEVSVYKVHDDSFYQKFGYDLFAVSAVSQNGGNVKTTFIAEKYGKLILKSNGGIGGSGGSGGTGVDGFDENDKGSIGSGTNGGDGGKGGDGGAGGTIKIYIDSAAKDFIKYLEVQNAAGTFGKGGSGGKGGQGGLAKTGTRARDGEVGANGTNGTAGKDEIPVEIIYGYVRF